MELVINRKTIWYYYWLKLEISRKNREIEDAKKRLNIIEREIEKYRKHDQPDSGNLKFI
jgi:hypothetical protein